MRSRTSAAALAVTLFGAALATTPAFAKPESYTIDPVHSVILFRIKHADVGYVYGRFNDFGGTLQVDEQNHAGSSVKFEAKASSVDTANQKRDDHLRSPDFFNVAQFPTISFQSTAVKKVDDKTLEVAGNLTIHGVTKPVTLRMERTGVGEFPKGTVRIGFEGSVVIRRSDFGMTTMPDVVGDEVRLTLAVEATKQP
jgi:polyisoprenoid-binding protein YceI